MNNKAMAEMKGEGRVPGGEQRQGSCRVVQGLGPFPLVLGRKAMAEVKRKKGVQGRVEGVGL